jgi:hypothetical protein
MSGAVHDRRMAEFPQRLAESARFHMGIGDVHQTVRELAADLEAAGIDYAIVGAMALNAHGFAQETTDVYVLITPAGLERFREQLAGRGYVEAFAGARKTFRSARTRIKVEFIAAGEYPGDGKPKPVAFPDPAQVAQRIGPARFADLPTLINLKLASGMTQPARRRDLADVQDLIRVLRLDAGFAGRLHPFVRDVYQMLLREVQADDPIEERPPGGASLP